VADSEPTLTLLTKHFSPKLLWLFTRTTIATERIARFEMAFVTCVFVFSCLLEPTDITMVRVQLQKQNISLLVEARQQTINVSQKY